ncbi:threonine/serine exporter family protein [Vibrio chagasii]|nr:threonine/serine exporter family protein [Vibrio chagasii]
MGLSCASLVVLVGGDWQVFMMTFIASACKYDRQAGNWSSPTLTHWVQTCNHSFSVTTTISAQARPYNIGGCPTIVMASSVLMLVPGYFPLINSVADMLKGHINMGLVCLPW